ncbi:MAG: preprotein translocase subunit YajC [bacterium]
MIDILWAAENAAGPAAGPQGGIMGLMPFFVIIGIFYFLLIRPQQKKAKEHQKTLSELKRGDRILTSGGIYGVITALRGKIIEVKIADEVKIQVSRSSISGLAEADSPSITEAEIVNK